MFNHIAHYFSSIIHIVIIIWFGGVFFERRKPRVARIIVSFIIIPLAFPYVNSLGILWLNLLASTILITAILLMNFNAKFRFLAILSLATVVVNMVCELVTVFVAGIVFGENIGFIIQMHIYSVSMSFISMMLYFTIAWMVRVVTGSQKRQHRAIHLASSFRVLLLLLMTIILGYFIMYCVQFEQGHTLAYIGLTVFVLLIAVDVTMLFGTERDYRRYERQTSLDAMALQEALNTEIIVQQQKNLNQLHAQAHDHKNQLVHLEEILCRHNDDPKVCDTADRYLNEQIERLNHSIDNNQFVGIKSKALQAILCRTASECLERDISFITEITFSDFDFMKYTDICSFFANALDNALFACKSIMDRGRSITLEIHKFQAMITIEISNSYKLPVIRGKDGFVSQKEPSAFRIGIGTKNMQRCVELYGGTIHFANTDSVFTVAAHIPML